MSHRKELSFSGFGARIQYHLLMGLFQIAFSRGLYGRFARGLGHLFGSRNAVLLSRRDEPPFKIYLNDGYWTRFALFFSDYETEIEQVLKAATGHTEVFCDLGANKGYWSVRAAPLFRHVIAVEASARTFDALVENTASLSNVQRHKKAIHAESGHEMQFLNVPLSHASARIANAKEGADETVATISIDDLLPVGTAALIKLDVEGAEIAAIDGGARALRDGSVVLYEDHGNDPECLPSARLLRDKRIRVYSIDGMPERLENVAEIRALKIDAYKGYNFMAAREDSTLLGAILESFANRQA